MRGGILLPVSFLPTLSDMIGGLKISPIRRVTALLDQARQKQNIISFGGGAPSLPPPPEVVEHMCRLIEGEAKQTCSYTGTRGIPELRELIAEDTKKWFGVSYDPKQEIIVTNGGTEGICCAFMSLLNKNDEVILMDPTYLGYREAAKIAGARIKSLSVNVERGFQPDVEDLKQLISPTTKLFVLLSPDNPTGRVVETSFAGALVDLAEDHDFWIVSDEAYKHIVYDGDHVLISGMKNAHERVVSVNTFSKEASIPGLRLGYVLAPPEVVEAMEKIKQYISLAPNSLAQFAMVRFLQNGTKERYLKETVIPTYKKRRDFMREQIRRHLPEARTTTPAGAFYYFVDMSSYLEKMDRTDEGFADRLLLRKSVVIIPGSYFGEGGRQHIRLTFVSEPEERIRVGFEHIDEYITSYTF